MRARVFLLPLLLTFAAACNPDREIPASKEELLLRASRRGDLKTVVILLDRGADIETRHPGNGWTPMMWMATRGHRDGIKLLLARGARLEPRDTKGQTPLMAAARWGRKDGVAAMLDAGANIEAKDLNGWTALMAAAFKGQREMAAYLLERGASIGVRDGAGHDALMLAAMKGHDDIVTLLLANGARDAGAAAELAEKSGYRATAALLRAPVRASSSR